MAGFFGRWSKTAGSNATADSTINWQEGQAPSSVNDSARGMMAAIASFRDDVAGSLVCGGTSTAYTLTTNQAFASLADMDGQEITFVITPTNGDAATLNVNSLGAKALVFSAGNAMPAGSLIDGSVYTATYVNASNCWKVHGFFGDPYNIPIGGGLDYWGSTVPNANFAFADGTAISRTTYAALFAIMGTTYGVGNGSSTFNLPDKRGRVTAMKEASASKLTSTYFGGNSANLGAVGGLESNNVLLTHTHSNSLTDPGHTHIAIHVSNGAGGGADVTVGAGGHTMTDVTLSNTTGITLTNASAGSASAHNIVQPTIICNYIIRIA